MTERMMQTNMEHTKTTKSAEAGQQVQALRDQFAAQHKQSERKLNVLQELLDKVGKQIELQKQSNEQLIEVKAKQLDELQTKTAEVIAEEIAHQQATDENIDNLIKEKTQEIKRDIQVEGGHSNEVI